MPIKIEDCLLRLSDSLSCCRLCPRDCGVDRRQGQLGYCRIDERLPIASICAHQGEEPVISGENGICNVFFSHCTLQCRFCQNHQISRNQAEPQYWSLERTLRRIEHVFEKGIDMLGFVSPSHVLPQMVQIIDGLWRRGHHPTIVYNSGGYDKVDSLRQLEGLVDVYLPDLKYMDSALAQSASDAANYPTVAQAAIQEMFRQMGGAELRLDDAGLARRGLIIRHLVLPGHPENSTACLDWIAKNLATDLHISLMSQYHPTAPVVDLPPFARPVSEAEYDRVCLHLGELGFENGWIQELDSHAHYCPDFDQELPFQ